MMQQVSFVFQYSSRYQSTIGRQDSNNSASIPQERVQSIGMTVLYPSNFCLSIGCFQTELVIMNVMSVLCVTFHVTWCDNIM